MTPPRAVRPRIHTDGSDPMADDDDPKPESDMNRGLRSFGRALETVTGRLFGSRVTGKAVRRDDVAFSPGTDAALERAGEDLGRLLHAAGEGLKAHPMRPAEALRVAREHQHDEPEAREGLTQLSTGILNLGGGVARVAEGVLDTVAPRKTKVDDGAAD